MDRVSLKLLLVEDNLTDVLLLEDVLREVTAINIELIHAKRLDEALVHLHSGNFDAVLLDLGLPDSQGIETFSKMQSHHPSVSILVMSGLEDESLAVRAVQGGAQDYLVKGKINNGMLSRTIRYAVERKRVEERLANSELGYRRLFEAAQDGIFIIDLESGKITEANPYLEKLLGYSSAEFIGKQLSEIAPFQNHIASEIALRILDHKTYLRYDELPLTTPDQQRIYVDFSSNVFGVRDKQVIQCNLRDASERKLAKDHLRDSEANLARAQQIARLGSWELDLSREDQSVGDSLRWSDQVFRILGYEPREIEVSKTNLRCALHPEDRERVMGAMSVALESGEGYNVDYRILLPEGDERYVHEHAEIVFDSAVPHVKLVGTLQDITLQKLAEVDRARLQAKIEQQREQLNTILANVPGVVWESWKKHDGAESPLDFVSEYVETLTGYTKEEWLATPSFWLSMVHADDRERAEREGAAVLNGGPAGTSRFRWIAKDGRISWVEARMAAIRDDSGRAVGMRGVTLDITEQIQAEADRDRFFTMSLDSLTIAGVDGYFKRVNPAFCKTLGYTESELLAAPFGTMTHPDDQGLTAEAVERLALGLPVNDFLNRYRTKDGQWRTMEWNAISAPAEGLIYAAARDVTEREAAEATLRRMHDDLEIRVQTRTAELAQTNASLLIEVAEREEAEAEIRTRVRQQETVAEFGRRALTDAGLESLMSSAVELVHDTLRVEISSILELLPAESAFRIRASIGLNTGEDLSNVRIPDGTGSIAGYALSRNSPMIVADMRTEKRFRLSERLTEHGVVSGMAVIVHGHALPFGTMSAYTTESREFTLNDIHFLQAMANVLAAVLERHAAEEEVRDLNLKLERINQDLNAENSERRLAMEALRENSLILADAKKEAEQAREIAEVANGAKSEFLSRMSHELRTPLNAILGFAQIMGMRDTDVDRQQTDNIRQILKAGRHLLNLINEVLDIASIEAGSLSLSPEPIALGRLVRDVMDLMDPLAASRRIRMTNWVPSGDGGPYVLADHHRLKQILLNLLSNAVKYNHDGGSVVVSCEASPGKSELNAEPHSRPLPAERILISIRDTGPGLKQADLARLFVPFERLEAASSQTEGSGIGLSLCKSLAHAMNGKIGVESEVGTGSTFWLELPLAQGCDLDEDAVSDDLMGAAFAVPDALVLEETRTVLYIEDNLSNIELIERMLAMLSGKIKLLTAMQGSQGLEMASQHHPDLILLDVNLPDMAGDVVISRLKANPTTKSVPVIVLSADTSPRQIEKLSRAGADDYLTKPIDFELFFDALRKIL